MCLTPITIRTRKHTFCCDTDPLFYTVPCGHCKECLQHKQNSWAVRSYYELKRCMDNNGFALFITLTYDNNHLPWFDLVTTNYSYTLPCFCKSDITHFVDLLRKRLLRSCGRNIEIKYLITSEYGGKSHRPHYHGILYIYDNVYIDFVRQTIRDIWKHGFVGFGDNGGLVTDYKACVYVTKYITKDFTFSSLLKDFNKNDMSHDDYLAVKRNCFPFHLQSSGFGLCIKDYVDPDLLYDGFVPMPTKQGVKMYPIPQYIERKLFYKLVDGSYVLTLQGAQRKLDNFKNVVQNFSNGLKNLHSIVNEIGHKELHDILSLTLPSNFTFVKNDPYELKRVWDLFFSNNSYEDLTLYILNERHYMSVSDLHHFEHKAIIHNYFNHISKAQDERYKTLSYYSIYQDVADNNSTFDKAKEKLISTFHPFEEFAILYDYVKSAFGYLSQLAYIDTCKAREEAKIIKNKYTYGNQQSEMATPVKIYSSRL